MKGHPAESVQHRAEEFNRAARAATQAELLKGVRGQLSRLEDELAEAKRERDEAYAAVEELEASLHIAQRELGRAV